MKKRLISILLTVLMVMSMFTGMSVSAYADDVIDSSYYKEYTLAEGDYVLRICQRMGINYYTCKEAIMALNNITSENGFRYLSVGETVKIPVSDAAAVAIMTGKPVGSTGTTGSGTADISGSDAVKYYLIPYTMQRGETVLGVCNSLGINFTNNADLIQSVNGIKSWNGVKAGDTILLPSTKTPAVGTTCYAVTAHKIASGETTYTICQNKGINYGSSTKLLQALNPKTNFSSIKAGATMYLPIVTTIKAASTNTNTGNTNTGNTTDKNNTTTDKNNTTTTAKAYDINANINTTYGSMKFYVDNKEVNTAAEGAVVTVDVITKDNKAVESLVVKYDDGRADLNLESNSFIMPACDVRVDANIKSGYDITINSNYSMKTVAQVSGINVSSASAGNSVKIVSTDPSYAVKEVEAYYSTLFGLKKNIVTVNSQFAFSMPDKDVTVDVTMAPVDTYNFFRVDAEHGSFDIQVDGSSVSKAAKGAKVTVVWQPMAGYEIKSITVNKADKDGKPLANGQINVFNNSFTMPACPVIVDVDFAKSANVIDIEAVEGGVLIAKVGGEVASEALTGQTVTVTADGRESGYEADQIKELVVTRKADGHRVDVIMDGTASASFIMPAGGVTVSGKLVSVDTNTVTVKFNDKGSENRVTIKADGEENWTVNDTMTGDALKNTYAVGTDLRLSTLARDTHAFNKFEVYVAGGSGYEYDAELTEKANSQSVITMPNKDIRIEATFKAGLIEIGQATVIGNGTVSYKVNGVTALSAKVGDTVTIVPASADPNLSVAEKDISVVVNNDNKTELKVTKDANGGFSFQMPKDGVSITVTFATTPHKLTLKTVDNTYGKDPTALQGQNLWGIYNTKTGTTYDVLYENNDSVDGTVIDCHSGEAIIVTLTKALTDKYNVEKVVMTGTKTGDVHEGGVEYNQGSYRFFMANEDLTITVYLKEKTSKSCSLLDLSYDSSKLTVGCTVGAFDSDVVTSCMVGDIVYVIPKVINSAEYELKADGITITKKSSDNVGKGSFTQGAANVPNADMVANTYYPAVDSSNNVVGWKYIMPEGGVNVSVAVSAVPYDITLSVKDTNGNDTAANGNKLNASGYVVVNTTENNVTTARQVANGIVEDVKFNQAVKVTLSEAGAKLYKIKSVAVAGVTVNNNGFWMPANDAALEVILEAKEVAPTKVNIKTASLSNGTVQYYADAACTQLIADNKAEVGKYIYAVATPSTGYQLSNFSATNSNDKTVIADMTKGNEGNGKFSILVPEHDINVSAAFEIKSYTLTINLEVDAHAEQVKVQVGNGTINTVTSKTQTVIVPYNSTVKLTVANTNEFTLVDAPVTPADASVAAVSVSKNASSASFKMPASDATVAVDLNSK